MKIIGLYSILLMIFISACSHCTWVKTGYHYTWDGEYVEEGYYDCPEENPVSFNIQKLPEISVDFDSESYIVKNKGNYRCKFKINNVGNGAAYSVHCLVTIKRPDVPGIMTGKTIENERNIECISAAGCSEFTFSFGDIAYTGCCLFDGTIEVTYKSENDESFTVSKYFSL